jgi:hypothetical protein
LHGVPLADEVLTSAKGESKDFVLSDFFCGLPSLAWFIDILESNDLNWKLGSKRLLKSNLPKSGHISMFGQKIPPSANFRFWVFHHNGRKGR